MTAAIPHPTDLYRRALVGGVLTSLPLVLLTVGALSTGDNNLTGTVVVLLVSVTLVTSLQLFVGNSGILSFGHVAFMGVGAYVAALSTIPLAIRRTQLPDLPAFVQGLELGLVPAVLLGGGVAALLGLLVGLVLVRMNVNAFVMSTLALLIVVFTVMVNWMEVTRGGQGIFGVPRLIDPWAALVAACLFIGVARLYKASGPGLRVRASREDELAARAAGIDVPGVRLAGFVLSAAMMGAAGSVWALNIIAFGPDQFSFAMTFSLLAMLVVGGKESVLGAAVGAVVVVLVTELLSRVEQGVVIGAFELPRITGTVQFGLATLIIVSLIWRPDGLVGRREAEDLVARPRRRRSPAPAPSPVLAAHPAPASDTEATPVPVPADGAVEPVLVGRGLSKSFGGVRALVDIDIEVRPGEILGVIGPNGSGKSTLLNVLSGVTVPERGQVILHGADITGAASHRTARRGLARTFQNIRLFSHLTVLENALAPHGSRPDVVRHSLTALDLAAVSWHEADTLSYGKQRRLEIARATATRPSVVLLDEPAAGMNEAESDVLMEDIRAIARDDGCAIVIIDHDLRLIVRLCDRIQVLETGRTLAVDKPQRIVDNPAVRAAYLGDMVGLGLEPRLETARGMA